MKKIIRLTENELISLVRRVIKEDMDAVNITINGDVQRECNKCNGDTIDYVILDTLRTISDLSQITSQDKTYVEYEIQNYSDVNKVKSVLELKLKTLLEKQITCTVNGNNITCQI